MLVDEDIGIPWLRIGIASAARDEQRGRPGISMFYCTLSIPCPITGQFISSSWSRAMARIAKDNRPIHSISALDPKYRNIVVNQPAGTHSNRHTALAELAAVHCKVRL